MPDASPPAGDSPFTDASPPTADESPSRESSPRESSPDESPPTPSPDAVRDALRALATGTAPARRPAFRETISEAEAATDCALEATAFLAAGRLPELARAVADAEHADETGTAERGAEALAALRRLDAAAAAHGDDPRDAESADGDHFHRARGIVLPPTGQATDR